MSILDPIATENAVLERRNVYQAQDRLFGHVVSCTGSKAIIVAQGLPADISEEWTVSRLISIAYKQRRIVGMISAVELPSGQWKEDNQSPVNYHVELIGEVYDDPLGGKAVFDRGVSAYPPIGVPSHAIRASDLDAIYANNNGQQLISIGNLSQNAEIEAKIDLELTLSRHFAIIGSTGVGKSSAVSLIMRKAVETRRSLRVVMLDPHNEFAHAFPKHAIVFDSERLSIPYWMLTSEELIEVIYRERTNIAEVRDALNILIAEAKNMFRSNGDTASLRRDNQSNLITADTPIPYRFTDLLKQIDERMGMLESKNDLPMLRALRGRLTATMNDPRFAVFFRMRRIADNMEQVITDIFRLEADTDKPIAVIQMAGMPNELVNSLISVIGRLAFDVCQMSSGGHEILMLCEEAHRYMPANAEMAFGPTRYAFGRIAKEGRKYGCYLGCITQRPGELDQTIFSQCSTIFAMRLSNESDQTLMRAAISDSSQSVVGFISSLGQRETIAFGEGVATPMRLKFETIADKDLPSTRAGGTVRQKSLKMANIGSVIMRMRDNLPTIQTNIIEAPSEMEEFEGLDEMARIRQAVMQRSVAKPVQRHEPEPPRDPYNPDQKPRLFR